MCLKLLFKIPSFLQEKKNYWYVSHKIGKMLILTLQCKDNYLCRLFRRFEPNSNFFFLIVVLHKNLNLNQNFLFKLVNQTPHYYYFFGSHEFLLRLQALRLLLYSFHSESALTNAFIREPKHEQ